MDFLLCRYLTAVEHESQQSRPPHAIDEHHWYRTASLQYLEISPSHAVLTDERKMELN